MFVLKLSGIQTLLTKDQTFHPSIINSQGYLIKGKGTILKEIF